MNLTHTKQKNSFFGFQHFIEFLFLYLYVYNVIFHCIPSLFQKKNIHTYKMISMHIVMWNVF